MYIVYKPVKLHYENMIYADISIYVPGAFSIKHIMLSKYKKKVTKESLFMTSYHYLGFVIMVILTYMCLH